MEYFICSYCPNGCRLYVKEKDILTAEIGGNQCSQGIVYIRSLFKRRKNFRITAQEMIPRFSKKILRDIVGLWARNLKSVHHSLTITGSPERSLFRVVVEDDKGVFFLLEQVSHSALNAKENIALALEFFKERGLDHIHPYYKNHQGNFILKHATGFWQMSPFLQGVPLDRANYFHEKWRGPVLADFLIKLRTTSFDIPFFDRKKVFSMKNYLYRFMRQVQYRDPKLIKDINPAIQHLEQKWMLAYETLPVSFCHGDYHPMNIVWKEKDMVAVIDWEFCGYKPEVYDIANLIGCLGVEHPSSLFGDLVGCFLERIQSSGQFSRESLLLLPDFVLATRFGWLSEWLRRRDAEMIKLELTYMHLLMGEKDKLFSAWDLSSINF